MTLKYLDGEEQLVFWLSDKPSWMNKLDPIEFSDEELSQIEKAWKTFAELQDKLSDRYNFSKSYV